MGRRIDYDEWLRPWVTAYADRLVRFLWTYTADEEAAKDLTQEVFLRLYREHRRYPGRVVHGGWLYSVGRRLAIDLARRNRVAEKLKRRLYVSAPAEDPTTRLALEALLDRLPARDREVLFLFYYQGWSTEEIARHYGCPVATVRTKLYRARDKLKKLWGNDEHASAARRIR